MNSRTRSERRASTSKTPRRRMRAAATTSMLLLSLCHAVSAEDDDIATTANIMDNDGQEEEWQTIFLLSSIIFGFFMTLFCAFVGYFSHLEDALMRSYLKEGQTVEGMVKFLEFARNNEYVAFVEYRQTIRDSYHILVRKQIKARESDFMSCSERRQPRQRNGNQQVIIKTSSTGSGSSSSSSSPKDQTINLKEALTSIGADDNLKDRSRIQLLVLPGYEQSGYPKKQVERICSVRYRWATLTLIFVSLCLAAFCIRVAAVGSSGNGNNAGIWVAVMVVTVMALELLFVHCCCRQLLLKVLKEEYLLNGQLIAPYGMMDDSSLSSASNDIYLSPVPSIVPIV